MGTTPLAGKKLGLLLSTDQNHPNAQTTLGLIKEALSQGVTVYLYLIDEGVTNAQNPEFFDLSQKGVKLFVCAFSCQRKGIPRDDRFTYCGLVVLSELVNTCDRFISFN